MKKIAAIAALYFAATSAIAMPVAPLKQDDLTLQARSSRSAISGRFVTRGYANRHRSTTVTHGKY